MPFSSPFFFFCMFLVLKPILECRAWNDYSNMEQVCFNSLSVWMCHVFVEPICGHTCQCKCLPVFTTKLHTIKDSMTLKFQHIYITAISNDSHKIWSWLPTSAKLDSMSSFLKYYTVKVLTGWTCWQGSQFFGGKIQWSDVYFSRHFARIRGIWTPNR